MGRPITSSSATSIFLEPLSPLFLRDIRYDAASELVKLSHKSLECSLMTSHISPRYVRDMLICLSPFYVAKRSKGRVMIITDCPEHLKSFLNLIFTTQMAVIKPPCVGFIEDDHDKQFNFVIMPPSSYLLVNAEDFDMVIVDNLPMPQDFVDYFKSQCFIYFVNGCSSLTPEASPDPE